MRALLPVMLFMGAIGIIAIVLVQAPEEPTGEAFVFVDVIGPDGATWFAFNGTISPAHALRGLQAAAEAAGVPVHLRELPGFGSCSVYVEGIGTHMEQGSQGWVFAVLREDGSWNYPPHSANCAALEPGDHLRWHWGTESNGPVKPTSSR